MTLPSIETVTNFWNTGTRYRPSGSGQPSPTYGQRDLSVNQQRQADRRSGGRPIAGGYPGGQGGPPSQQLGGGGDAMIGPPGQQQVSSQIPQDPYAFFSGTSPYGNYAKQVAEGYNPSELPRLMIPSMQTWARMGPQFQQQYYGYKQAQTGAIPEQSNWNIMRLAPPSGQQTQLGYRR